MKPYRVVAFAIALSVVGMGCGDSSTSRTSATSSISISPLNASMPTSGTLQFGANVNNNAGTAVTWQVNGTPGGNSTIGIISTTGLYTAPFNVPNPTTVAIMAVSQANTTLSASANVNIVAASSSLTVIPITVSLVRGSTLQFNTMISGSTTTPVSWAVNGVAGGNATVGTISTSGLYTAPSAVPNPNTVTVTATSQANSSINSSATITIS